MAWTTPIRISVIPAKVTQPPHAECSSAGGGLYSGTLGSGGRPLRSVPGAAVSSRGFSDTAVPLPAGAPSVGRGRRPRLVPAGGSRGSAGERTRRQVDHDRLLAAAGQDDDRLLRAGVLLAVRRPRRDEDVVAGLGGQPDLLAVLGEDEHGVAGDDVDGRLGLAVVVVARAAAGPDVRLPHPDLLRADARARDRLQALHAAAL